MIWKSQKTMKKIVLGCLCLGLGLTAVVSATLIMHQCRATCSLQNGELYQMEWECPTGKDCLAICSAVPPVGACVDAR